MRFFLTLLLFALPTTLAAQEGPAPDQLARHWAQFLQTQVPQEQWPYAVCFSWSAVPSAKLPAFQRVFAWWIHQLSFRPGVCLPQEVPGTNGWLTWVDLRDYGWNGPAWRNVAEREPFTHEPRIDPTTAAFLRRAIGLPITKETLARQRFPVQSLVRADWFFRETIESARSTSYFDLLFANRRYPKAAYWKGGASGGRDYAASWYYERPFVDFPRDEKDWDEAFGIDTVKAFGLKNALDLDFGAIVEGGLDNPRGGSIVTLQNRLIAIHAILTATNAWSGKSFDTQETSGLKDYVQSLIYGGKPYKPGQGAVAESDGGEFLATLPNGGQAGFLVNAQRKRLEVAPTTVANDTSDPRLNQGVRTNGSCASCHAEHYGLIPPRNLFEEMTKRGVETKFKDREQLNRTLAFFTHWDDRVAPLQQPYKKLIALTTGTPETLAWTGPELAKQFRAFWHWYDEPLALGQAAREMGAPAGIVQRAADLSPNARLKMLTQGMHVPRRTWDVDVYRELMLLMNVPGK